MSESFYVPIFTFCMSCSVGNIHISPAQPATQTLNTLYSLKEVIWKLIYVVIIYHAQSCSYFRGNIFLNVKKVFPENPVVWCIQNYWTQNEKIIFPSLSGISLSIQVCR